MDQERAQRLAQALRDNLRKRKAHPRAKAAERPADEAPPAPPVSDS